MVVDNASQDESVNLLRSDFPEIEVITNDENLGLAAGINLALGKVNGNYILVLNPDIVVLAGALEKMVNYMEKQADIGIMGGKLLSPNGVLQESCFRFYKPMTVVYRRTLLGQTAWGKAETDRFLMKDFDHQRPRDVDWLMGSCYLLRDKAIKEVGGMDERFFLYFEDVDWCRRFWEKKWRVTYYPEAEFSHYYQRSSRQGGVLGKLTNRAFREHIKSAVKYFWKYRGKKEPHSD